MANPTLSFVEPASHTEFLGDSAPSRLGATAASVITTGFEIDRADRERATKEILEQAEAAGYRVELISSEKGLPNGNWHGTPDPASDLVGELTLLVSPTGLQVELR